MLISTDFSITVDAMGEEIIEDVIEANCLRMYKNVPCIKCGGSKFKGSYSLSTDTYVAQCDNCHSINLQTMVPSISTSVEG